MHADGAFITHVWRCFSVNWLPYFMLQLTQRYCQPLKDLWNAFFRVLLGMDTLEPE